MKVALGYQSFNLLLQDIIVFGVISFIFMKKTILFRGAGARMRVYR
jgi:hypothetical protein